MKKNIVDLHLERPSTLYLGGIPEALPNSAAHAVQWKHKFNAYLQNLEKRAERTGSTKLQTGIRQQQASIKKILPELLLQAEQIEIVRILQARIPSQQHLDTYSSNIFRDWVWGEKENVATISNLKKSLTGFEDKIAGKSGALLGVGSARSAVDFHNAFLPHLSLAVDINPLLLCVAKRLLAGESLELVEFPSPARDSKSVAVQHKIETQLRKPEGFEFLFADALNLPFKKESLDFVFTPWLIDILPISIEEFSKRLNYYLKPGGIWINSGPLGYTDSAHAHAVAADQIEDVLSRGGFKLAFSGDQQLPYLQSPSQSSYRVETVHTHVCEKISSHPRPDIFRSLPKFITNPEEKFILSEDIERLLFEAQNRRDLLSLIDGERSLSELADLISKHSNISKESALENLLLFFTPLFEHEIK